MDKLLSYFDATHLPAHLAVHSRRFGTLAAGLAQELKGVDDDQLAMALEHLLIAKDAAVRVAVARQRQVELVAGTSSARHDPPPISPDDYPWQDGCASCGHLRTAVALGPAWLMGVAQHFAQGHCPPAEVQA